MKLELRFEYERGSAYSPEIWLRAYAGDVPDWEAGAKWVLPVETDALPSNADIFRAALEEIRNGHNDPRALAAKVLNEVSDFGIDEVRVELR